MVDAVVCLALLITVVAAKVVGAVLPMLAKRIKFDPGVTASPFITTMVDALSLLVYFLIARMLLKI
jgi:magnesium transporter